MDVSLNSALNPANPFIYRPPQLAHHNCGRFVSVSCSSRSGRSSAKLALENEIPNYYRLLHLSPEKAGVNEVKRAYRRMSLQCHPDVCDPSMKEESTRMFVQLNAAYKTLSDPLLRTQYDYDMGLSEYLRQPLQKGVTREMWEDQIVELKRRSNCRMAQKERGSASRMKARSRRI